MRISGPSSQDLGSGPTLATRVPSERWRQILPRAHQDRTITCYDDLGRSKTHGLEQRYVSPTTGICRKLVVQAVRPKAPNERRIRDHTGHVSKLALWLLSTNPFHRRVFLIWIGTWFLFTLKLFWSIIWFVVQVFVQLFLQMYLSYNWSDDSEVYNTGDYKPYIRGFVGQLWAARSKKEYSTRVGVDKKGGSIPTHSLYPRLLMIRDPTRDEWLPCTEPSTIMSNRYIAISYCASEVYASGPNGKGKKEQFIQEVRNAAVQKNFDAYWLDLECIGETLDEQNLDIYCMADVYRGAESTLIMLGNSWEGERAAWERWGGRVWTLPEALLSQQLFYKFRDRSEINSVSLHQLANLAYSDYELEQAVVNAYSGKDPLERLERLSLLKSAIWRRGINIARTGLQIPRKSVSSPPSTQSSAIEKTSPTGSGAYAAERVYTQMPLESVSYPPSTQGSAVEKTPPRSGPHAAERVYALMGFFEHRIQPNHDEDELLALVRLSMANDNDRIAERMVSLLPSTIHHRACWYADDDIYDANLWDVLPSVQVAGVTENGALVLDGCHAASIRWKDFPEIAFDKADSVRRTVIGFIPYLTWPILIVGIVAAATFSLKAGMALLVTGAVLLLISPGLFVISEGGRVVSAQPWFIGVKGVLDIDAASKHLYGGGNVGCHPRLDYTSSGSEFAVPDQGSVRRGAEEQYENAKRAEAEGVQMFTLIDTYASAVYYFRAERPPTVCLFTGREGGLGRFVLCSERCAVGELHKETVLRMPTEVSQRMEMCGWVALG